MKYYSQTQRPSTCHSYNTPVPVILCYMFRFKEPSWRTNSVAWRINNIAQAQEWPKIDKYLQRHRRI